MKIDVDGNEVKLENEALVNIEILQRKFDAHYKATIQGEILIKTTIEQ